MAAVADLNVRIGADISEVQAKMVQGAKSVDDFSKKSTESVKRVTGSLSSLEDVFASVTNKLNQNIDAAVFKALETNAAKLEKQLSDLNKEALSGSTSFTKLGSNLNPVSKELAQAAITSNKLDSTLAKGKGADQAAIALQNLGRVAQDVPYGFMGIQNNLNPLLESFQRLKKESGSTTGALKAIISSLTGAGGMGLALSLITAAVSFATIGFSFWTRGMGGTKKALDETSKSAKEAADSYKSIVSSVAQEVIKVEVLVEQLKKENLSRKQRTAAIKELQRISPEYFANLNAEKTNIQEITKAYDQYAAAIIKSINYKLATKDLEDVEKKILDLQKKQVDFETKSVDENGKLLKSKNALYDAENKGESEYERFAHGRGMLTEAENTQLKNLIRTRDELLANLAKNAPKPTPLTNGEKDKKDVETIADVLKKLAIQIDFLNQKELLLHTDQSQEKINAIESTVDHLMQKFKLLADNPVIIRLQAQAADVQLQKLFKDQANDKKIVVDVPVEFKPEPDKNFQAFDSESYNLRKILKGLGVTKTKIGIPIDTANIQELRDTLTETQKRLADMANFTIDTLSPAFDALFQGILSGSQNAFQSFGQALEQTIVQLGAAALKAAVLAAILSSIEPGVSFGGAFKKLIGFSTGGQVKGFSTGGPVWGAGTATSDSIPARLSRGEYVIKATKVREFGLDFFNKINFGTTNMREILKDKFGMMKFATGGFVSPNSVNFSRPISVPNINIGGGQQLEITGDFQLRNDRLVAAVKRGTAQIGRNS